MLVCSGSLAIARAQTAPPAGSPSPERKEAPLPTASDPGPTPAEAAGFTDSPTYGATWAYLYRVAAACRHIKVASCGYSTEGNPLPVVFVWDRSGLGGAWDDGTPKPVVLINAGIHSGEICGNDALLMLLRDIARGLEPDILAHLRLVLVPILNVDGHLRRSLHHRFTQDGPAGGCGTRRNALGLDLNRDYAKLETPECRALVRLGAQFQPHIYVDLHTDDGFGHGYDVLFSPAVNPSFPGTRDALVRRELAPQIVREMAARGFHSHWIGWPRDRQDPAAGIVAYGITTRLGTGYFETRQSISILSEAYPYMSYERRVRATDALVRAILHFAATNCIRVCEIVDTARETAIRWGREPGRHEIALGCSADRERGRPITWRGKRFEMITSEVTGNRYALYNDEDASYELAFFDQMIPRTRVIMPRGYLMENAWGQVARTLRHHSIEIKRLAEPFTAEVEVYRIDSASFREAPYQGHHPLSDIEGTWSRERREFPAGTYWIPLDQPAGLTAMHLLEPESGDALLVWNAFDSIFERGIVLETWALEENARRLLDDPAIRAEYEAALADSAFANSTRARLMFFYRKTAYREDRQNRYPVYRLTTSAAPVRFIP
jgi:hypothetical protein